MPNPISSINNTEKLVYCGDNIKSYAIESSRGQIFLNVKIEPCYKIKLKFQAFTPLADGKILIIFKEL